MATTPRATSGADTVEHLPLLPLRWLAGIGAACAALAWADVAAGQCPQADRRIEFPQAVASLGTTELTRQIAVCTLHAITLQGRAGQRIALTLSSPSGQTGMLTLLAPSGERPVDGGMAWSGTLAETGTYTIEIGTDKTTTYTLRVVMGP